MTKRKKRNIGEEVTNARLPGIHPIANIRIYTIERICVRYIIHYDKADLFLPKALRETFSVRIIDKDDPCKEVIPTTVPGITHKKEKIRITAFPEIPGLPCSDHGILPVTPNRKAVNWFRMPVKPFEAIHLGKLSVRDGLLDSHAHDFVSREGHELGKYLIWPIDEWGYKIVLADPRDVT